MSCKGRCENRCIEAQQRGLGGRLIDPVRPTRRRDARRLTRKPKSYYYVYKAD